MLPGQQETHHDIVRDVRQNKGSILKASVEYIRRLKRDNTGKKSLEEKCRIQEFQNRKLLVKLQVGNHNLNLSHKSAIKLEMRVHPWEDPSVWHFLL